MRKYFLLTAAALMMATNVDAESNAYSELAVNVTIAHANEVNCSDVNFGTLYLKAGHGDVNVRLINDVTTESDSPDFVSADAPEAAYCQLDAASVMYFSSETVTLSAEGESKVLTFKPEQWEYNSINGTLSIPAGVTPTSYTGSFEVTFLSA
ncbi:MAG: hypothetical protein IJ019_00430 [Alphaproteobacteria bacterium]|nr:hypothetical protein [Alphaproteobacteria bacterium]